MIIDNETILILDQLYDSNLKKFIYYENINKIELFIEDYKIDKDYYDNLMIQEKIEFDEPILIIDTLHSCWTHAFIDNVFPYFWTFLNIQDKLKIDKINFFIRKKLMLLYPNNVNKITNDNKYIKNYQVLLDIIPHNKLIFEHLISDKKIYLFKKCIHYILNDKWQKSIWNCIDYYYCRTYLKKDVIYNDEIIKKNLDIFKKYILDKYNIEKKIKNNNVNIVILNKKNHKDNTSKIIEIPYLDDIINLINQYNYINFNGVQYLEDIDFSEQIKIFLDNDIIISSHGGALLHMIHFENKLFIEFFNNEKTNTMYKRISNFTNNKLIQININDLKNNILEIIKNIIH
jgi:hypothetical protein